jgi:hypothetical protein
VLTVCFVPVPRPVVSLGARLTCVALAGTAGALGMLAQRRGGIADMAAAAGYAFAPGVSRFAAATGGFVIHLVWVALWSVVLAAWMQRDRRPNPSIAALIIAALALATSFIVPAAIGGPLATLPTPERIVVHVVLAISLIIGMRLAPGG